MRPWDIPTTSSVTLPAQFGVSGFKSGHGIGSDVTDFVVFRKIQEEGLQLSLLCHDSSRQPAGAGNSRRIVLPIDLMIAAGVLFFLLCLLLAMAGTAVAERERRAVLISASLAFISLLILLAFLLRPELLVFRGLAWVILTLAGILVLLLLLKWMPADERASMEGVERFDERDHMFARAELKYHPKLLRSWEKMSPEKAEIDRKIHVLPELGEQGSRFFDEALSPMAAAAFSVLERSYPALVDRCPASMKGLEGEELFEALQLLASRYGAVDLGVTRTRPWHYYSHGGRQAEEWGREIEAREETAIVIVVPMDFRTIRLAPTAAVLMESSRMYVEAATIAQMVAEFLCLQGYEARAHVDARYQVLCVPLAEAAGLGHVGRMGILMHRIYGPCIRLSVVTTEAELPETSGDYSWMENFCRICKKCAKNCPSRAILDGQRPSSRNFSHWSIDQESCYSFWRRAGSDCSVCIASCPFTKPDSAVHRLVRWAIRRNPLLQRLALLGDDLVYGKKFRMRSKNPRPNEIHKILS